MAQIHKTIDIPAPPEQVYDLIAAVEEYPRFFRQVKSVRSIGGNNYLWEAELAGLHLSWHGQIVVAERPQHFAWESVTGLIRNRGCFRITSVPGGSRVNFAMTYELGRPWLERLLAPLAAGLAHSVIDEALVKIRAHFSQYNHL